MKSLLRGMDWEELFWVLLFFPLGGSTRTKTLPAGGQAIPNNKKSEYSVILECTYTEHDTTNSALSIMSDRGGYAMNPPQNYRTSYVRIKLHTYVWMCTPRIHPVFTPVVRPIMTQKPAVSISPLIFYFHCFGFKA